LFPVEVFTLALFVLVDVLEAFWSDVVVLGGIADIIEFIELALL
jgi:hypothetical protein